MEGDDQTSTTSRPQHNSTEGDFLREKAGGGDFKATPFHKVKQTQTVAPSALFLTCPARTASSNANGIDPADVLPYSSRFVIT